MSLCFTLETVLSIGKQQRSECFHQVYAELLIIQWDKHAFKSCRIFLRVERIDHKVGVKSGTLEMLKPKLSFRVGTVSVRKRVRCNGHSQRKVMQCPGAREGVLWGGGGGLVNFCL